MPEIEFGMYWEKYWAWEQAHPDIVEKICRRLCTFEDPPLDPDRLTFFGPAEVGPFGCLMVPLHGRLTPAWKQFEPQVQRMLAWMANNDLLRDDGHE